MNKEAMTAASARDGISEVAEQQIGTACSTQPSEAAADSHAPPRHVGVSDHTTVLGRAREIITNRLTADSASAGPDEVAEVARQVAGMSADADPLTLALVREELMGAARKAGLSAPARIVDAAFRIVPAAAEPEAGERQGQAIEFVAPQPWHEPVDGATLLSEMVKLISRYVVLPRGGATALAVWTMATWVFEAAHIFPLLNLKSATKGCGKSVALDLLGELVLRALPSDNITAAAIFRIVDRWRPTLLLDEADTFLDRDDLRGILNSGHRCGGFVIRIEGENREPRRFATYCPKAIAGIGNRAATLEDRSIAVVLKKKRPDEHVEHLRIEKIAGECAVLRSRLARWAEDNFALLVDSDPAIPQLKSDRAADNWRILVAVADAVGGIWPERVRDVAGILSGRGTPEVEEDSVLLLNDIRTAFVDNGSPRIPTEDLLQSLADMPGRPWAEWDGGSPMTSNQLWSILRPFGLRSKRGRVGDRNLNCAMRATFEDVWSRYLAPMLAVVQPEHSEQAA